MVSITTLPVETLTHITDYLTDAGDLSALSRSGSRFVHDVVTAILYARFKDDIGVLCWACDEGQTGTAKRLLSAGADPNRYWQSAWTRSEFINRQMDEFSLVRHNNYFAKLRPGHPVGSQLQAICDEQAESRCADTNEAWALDSVIDYDGCEGLECEECEGSECAECGDHGPSEDGDCESDGDSSTGPYDSDTNDSDSDSDDSDISDDSDSDSGSDIPAMNGEDGRIDAKRNGWTPLHLAAQWGYDDIVALLLDHGAKVDALSTGLCDCVLPHHHTHRRKQQVRPDRRKPRWTSLHTAICNGNDSTARLLLSRKASLHVTGGGTHGPTALHTACSSGFPSIARFLIEQSELDIEVEDRHGHTPLSYAYFTGMWECIDLLLEKGASLDVRIGDWPLLKHACSQQRFAEALRLLELGADPAMEFDEMRMGENPTDPPVTAVVCCSLRKWKRQRIYSDNGVELRAKRQKHLREEVIDVLVKFLKEQGLDDDDERDSWALAMLQAAANHLPGVITRLVEAGVPEYYLKDNRGKGAKRCSALHKALESQVSSGKGDLLATVKVILDSLSKKMTQTQVLEAISTMCGNTNKHPDKDAVVDLLLQHRSEGINLESKTAKKIWTRAIKNGNWKLCKRLVNRGLKVPAKNALGPLITGAIEVDSVAALKYLLTFKHSDEMILTGRRLFDALSNHKTKCAALLIDKGAPVDYRSPDGATCLVAASRLPIELGTTLAHKLLDVGADPNVIWTGPPGANMHVSPLWLAMNNDNIALMDLLLEKGARLDDGAGQPQWNMMQYALIRETWQVIACLAESEAFLNSSQEQLDRYMTTALTVPDARWRGGASFELLLDNMKCKKLNSTSFVGAGLRIPLLHFVVIQGRTPRPRAIWQLVTHGADIHQKADPSTTLTPLSLPLKGTTPLEWAIEYSASTHVVEEMLESLESLWIPGQDYSKKCLGSGLTPELQLDYVRAACQRQKSHMIALLHSYDLDFTIRDAAGNTAIHLVCDGMMEYAMDDGNTDWPPYRYAIRAAYSIEVLANQAGVSCQTKNQQGVSGFDAVRQRMDYEGHNAFWADVADCWKAMLVLKRRSIGFVDDVSGVLKEKYPDLDLEWLAQC